jgi:NCS1 family nucleobase:cation symporter-1
MGGYITAALGIAILPWKLLESTQGYIFTWLIGYSALLGPVGGIMIADYFIWRKQELHVDDLYVRGGAYEYRRGFNPAAMLALVVGVLPNIPGFCAEAGLVAKETVPQFLQTLYTYAWFVGFFLSGALYLALMRASGSRRV